MRNLTLALKETVRPYYLRWIWFRLFPRLRPAAFSDCWKYPGQPLRPGTVLEDTPGADPAILFLPMTDWHARIQRTQHLARSLAAAGHRCFCLNPHLGREYPRPYLFDSESRIAALGPGLRELHVRLPAEPVFHHRMLTAKESARLVEAVGVLVEAARIRRMVQVVSFPVWTGAALEIRRRFSFPLVYDCHDVLSGFRNIAPEIVAAEMDLFRASDFVLFSAENLKEDSTARFPALAGRAALLRNAVDDTWVRSASGRARGEEIVAGYAGALDYWFDVEAVEHAARAHPEWRFCLIGRVEDQRIRRLESLPNVLFRGEVPHVKLPSLLEQFRIALIPFLKNSLTAGTDPIKLYEYFSQGLPVVSARLPEVERFAPLVYLAESPEEFTRQMERAIEESDPALSRERIRIAGRETWSARAAELMQILQRLDTARISSR